jgi:hypothetical protein
MSGPSLDPRRLGPPPRVATGRAAAPAEPQVRQVQGHQRSFEQGALDPDSFLAARRTHAEASQAARQSVTPAARDVGPEELWLKGPGLDVRVDADSDISLKGIDLDLVIDIDATLAEAGASARKTVEVDVAGEKYQVDLDLSALGKVGAEGKLLVDIHIGTNGRAHVTAWAEGFAGARASLTGSLEVRHEGRFLVGGELSATAAAGVGGRAYLDMGRKGGTVYFRAGAEATVGAGLGVDVMGEAHMSNVLRAVGETGVAVATKPARDWLQSAGNTIGGLWDRLPKPSFG